SLLSPTALTRPASPAVHALSLHDALPISECGVSGQLLLTQPPRWCVPAGAGNHRDRVAGREGIGGGVIYPAVVELELVGLSGQQDRKSTRLNSSHVSISYAVFCLKKKTTR